MGMNREAQDITLDDYDSSHSLNVNRHQSSLIIPAAIATVGGLGLYSLYKSRKRNQSSVLPESNIPSQSGNKGVDEELKDTSNSKADTEPPSESEDGSKKHESDDHRQDIVAGDQGSSTDNLDDSDHAQGGDGKSDDSDGTEINPSGEEFYVNKFSSMGKEDSTKFVYDELDRINREMIQPFFGYPTPFICNAAEFDGLVANHKSNKNIPTDEYRMFEVGQRILSSHQFKFSFVKSVDSNGDDVGLLSNATLQSGIYTAEPPYNIELNQSLEAFVTKVWSDKQIVVRYKDEDITIGPSTHLYILGKGPYSDALKKTKIDELREKEKRADEIREALKIYSYLKTSFPLDTFVYEKERGYKVINVNGSKLNVVDDLPAALPFIDGLTAEKQSVLLQSFKNMAAASKTIENTVLPQLFTNAQVLVTGIPRPGMSSTGTDYHPVQVYYAQLSIKIVPKLGEAAKLAVCRVPGSRNVLSVDQRYECSIEDIQSQDSLHDVPSETYVVLETSKENHVVTWKADSSHRNSLHNIERRHCDDIVVINFANCQRVELRAYGLAPRHVVITEESGCVAVSMSDIAANSVYYAIVKAMLQ